MCLSVSCLLCHPTFASVTVHPQFILSHWLRALRPMQRSQVPNLCKALLQTKMLPAVVELVTGGGAHQFMYDPHPLLSSVSGNSDSCMLLEKKKKWSPNQYLPLAGMCIGTEWGKNKSFEHNMQACVQICFMAELELFLIVNMSRSFVPPTQKCVLLGVRFYSWPS